MRILATLILILAALPLAADDHAELLNDMERQWLASLGRPLIVATEDNYHPYNFFDEQGELSGFVGDYMRLLEERLEIKFEVRKFDTFADVLEAARKREVDILPLILASPERREYLDFTQPVYETRDHIFTRQENQATLTVDDLVGMKLGVVEGYTMQAEIAASHPGIEMVLVASELDGLRALSVGSVDAFITELGIASWYIQSEAITNLRIAGDYGAEGSETFGIRNDWPQLTSIIGKGIASITLEERAEIRRRWVSIEESDQAELERLLRQVGTVAGIIVFVLVGVLVWTFSLRRLVDVRTSDLEKELAERRVLEADKMRLAIAVEQSAEFILVIDISANIEYANRAFRHASGVSDIEGRPFHSLTGNGSGNELVEALRVARELGRWRGKVSMAGADDAELKINMAVVPIHNDKQEIDGYVATGRDISKEEALEARVQQGERLSALGTLAGGIAHDFNNLLVPILGYTDLIKDEVTDSSRPYVDGIANASRRARDLVNRIMVFGQGGSGEMLPLDIRFEIDDALSFLRSLLPTTITLEENLQESGTVLADRTQIQQLLLNLSTNASDAMAENGGTLTIKLEQRSIAAGDEASLPELKPGAYAVLTVRDTGIGMSDATREKIFDPYFSEREESGGTGLGLAIVHGIVARHEGFIDVDSTLGVGTSFRVFLPQAAVAAATPDTDSDRDIRSGKGETILLVDDDELVIATLKKMLEGIGYNVSAWSDPVAALNAFDAEPQAFDLILADLTMPNLTGTQLLSRARDIRPEIPCAIITGNPGALRQSGDQQVLAKPVPLDELAAALRELLDRQPV